MAGQRRRDTQRSKVYAAERSGSDRGRRLPTVATLQAEADRITHTAWFRLRFGLVVATITDGRGSRRGSAFADGRIRMPKYARQQRYLLHELAHLCAPAPAAGHGPEFARAYLDLMRHELGADAANALREAFRAHRVRFTVRAFASDAAACEKGA